LLENGISVITTINVQHLESLNDAVAQLTGVRVRETVPDAILRMASEVELIDVTPQMLQERMREGKIYASEKVNQALESFFKIGNLIALREVIFVCVDMGSRAERLIRRGFRIAHRLKAEWYVHYVHCSKARTPGEEKRLDALRQLTERLGGRMEVTEASSSRNLNHHLLHRMNEVQSTQLIIGQSRKPLWRRLFKESFVQYLLRQERHMDMLIVADFAPEVTEI